MSYNGTVRCGNCYTSGHNKTSCPELRKAWAEDPESYMGRQWQRILDRKAKPKICGYCSESGHTRAGCDTMKAHKSQFIIDANLWRSALAKWMEESQLGIGALVRCNDAAYHRGDVYMYPRDENYIPPVGLVMKQPGMGMSHYAGIMNTGTWSGGDNFISFERIGANEEHSGYRKTIGVPLPSIPGIVPRFGKGWYNNESMDRNDRINNADWEVVSPGQALDNSELTCPKQLRKITKHHFAGPQDQTDRCFKTFKDFQRTQLQQYVNGEIELSEMKDPELSDSDT